jgi:hypothetical protein
MILRVSDDPFDHNAECTFCDEQAMHRADCPWLLRLIADQDTLATTIRNMSNFADALKRGNAERDAKIADYTHSFELYHTASMALMHAYKRAHPEVPEDVWPDATQVNVWAAEQIDEVERLQREVSEQEKVLVFAEAKIAKLERESADLKVEHTRAVLRYTAKGYAAGENTDAKHWRERAEAAEADVATKNAALAEIADDPVVSHGITLARRALGWE